ncbi:hypothetical protein N566_22865 [Streptomycetaceae bacterium MP113-05]|nr:hypothetical protein N566_22865 [Streptomycetaceae bacterium MP113-05]
MALRTLRTGGDRPAHETTPTVYRPLPTAHRSAPRGQLARSEDGSWWYRPAADRHGSDAGEALPEFLRADLDHALRRRAEVLAEIDGIDRHDDRRASLFGIYCMLGTREIVNLETALNAAHASWSAARHAGTVAGSGAWVPAPRTLTRFAEENHPRSGCRAGR